MLRLLRYNHMCSSNVSDPANRLRKTRKKKSSVVPLFRSGHMSAICAKPSKGKGRFTRGWKPQVSTLLCARAASAHSPLRFSEKLPAPPVGGNAKAHSHQRHQRSDTQLYFNRKPKAPACTARRRAGIRPAAFHRNRNAAGPAGSRRQPNQPDLHPADGVRQHVRHGRQCDDLGRARREQPPKREENLLVHFMGELGRRRSVCRRTAVLHRAHPAPVRRQPASLCARKARARRP